LISHVGVHAWSLQCGMCTQIDALKVKDCLSMNSWHLSSTSDVSACCLFRSYSRYSRHRSISNLKQRARIDR